MEKAHFDPVTLAVPAFVVLIILEILAGKYLNAKARYETKDTAVSLAMGFGSTLAGMLTG
ncbi:sterol desaturase family protein, partial [Clostridioides difficile]|nr:sterol desaturase family protein [Clostridioides difficile]